MHAADVKAMLEGVSTPVDPGQPLDVAPAGVEGPPVAGRIQRVGAFLADGFVLGVLLDLMRRLGPPDGALVLVSVAYGIVGTAIWGQTVGKAFVRIRVVRAGTDGPPGWAWAVVRSIPFALAMSLAWAWPWLDDAALLVAVVAYAPVLWDPLRRGLHDRAAGTLVVDA